MTQRTYVLGGLGFLLTLAVALAYFTYRGSTPEPVLTIELRPQDANMVAMGRQIYTSTCAACHGSNLEGQPNWRRRNTNGRLPAPPHDENGHTWHHADAALFELTKYGPVALIGGNYESDMPGYEGTLTDEEILAVLSYIKSQWPEEIRDRHDQINAGGSHH